MAEVVRNSFKSAPFKFVVGGEAVYVHAELVAALSKPLDCLMHGWAKEAVEKVSVLENISADTFLRFCEWAYMGFYTPAEPFVLDEPCSDKVDVEAATEVKDSPPGSDAAENYPEPVVDAWNFPRPSKQKWRHRHDSTPNELVSTRSSMREAFVKSHIEITRELRPNPARANRDSLEDYKSVFLSHAELYIFGDMYDIQDLKTLALSNLRQTLAIFTLWPERATDVTAVVSYVYDNTKRPPGENPEPMRAMLMEYLGYELDGLINVPEFQEALSKHNELMEDFFEVLAKRI